MRIVLPLNLVIICGVSTLHLFPIPPQGFAALLFATVFSVGSAWAGSVGTWIFVSRLVMSSATPSTEMIDQWRGYAEQLGLIGPPIAIGASGYVQKLRLAVAYTSFSIERVARSCAILFCVGVVPAVLFDGFGNSVGTAVRAPGFGPAILIGYYLLLGWAALVLFYFLRDLIRSNPAEVAVLSLSESGLSVQRGGVVEKADWANLDTIKSALGFVFVLREGRILLAVPLVRLQPATKPAERAGRASYHSVDTLRCSPI